MEFTLQILRSEYEQAKRYDKAGPGTPSNPDAPGWWFIDYFGVYGDPKVLYTKVEVID